MKWVDRLFIVLAIQKCVWTFILFVWKQRTSLFWFDFIFFKRRIIIFNLIANTLNRFSHTITCSCSASNTRNLSLCVRNENELEFKIRNRRDKEKSNGVCVDSHLSFERRIWIRLHSCVVGNTLPCIRIQQKKKWWFDLLRDKYWLFGLPSYWMEVEWLHEIKVLSNCPILQTLTVHRATNYIDYHSNRKYVRRCRLSIISVDTKKMWKISGDDFVCDKTNKRPSFQLQ